MAGTNKILGGGFHHVALAAADFDRSVKFYCDVLGFTSAVTWGEKPHRAAMLDTGDGNYFELFERESSNLPPESVLLHVCIRCNDVKGIIERVRAAGMNVTMEPKALEINSTNGRGKIPITIAFFKGPDGEIVELFDSSL